MDQAAHVDALPVLRQELPVGTGLHDRMAFLAAHKAFHQAGLFIDQFHHVLFLGHSLISLTAGVIKAWNGDSDGDGLHTFLSYPLWVQVPSDNSGCRLHWHNGDILPAVHLL